MRKADIKKAQREGKLKQAKGEKMKDRIINHIIICKKTGRHLRDATDIEVNYFDNNQTNENYFRFKDKYPHCFTHPVNLNEYELIDTYTIHKG